MSAASGEPMKLSFGRLDALGSLASGLSLELIVPNQKSFHPIPNNLYYREVVKRLQRLGVLLDVEAQRNT